MSCITKIKERLKEDNVDGFLITNEVNVRYVTAFTGSESFLLITLGYDYLFTDFRYVEQAQCDIPWIKIVERKVSLIKTICAKLKRIHMKRLYVESSYLTLKQYDELKENLKEIRIIPTQGIIETYRMQKTPEEVKKIQSAIDIAERAYASLQKKIAVGMSEKNLADILEFEIRSQGAQKGAFEIISAIGDHASQPHARPSHNRKIDENDVILIDWGACFQFYNSDLTRVMFVDKITPQWKKIYQIVLDAQQFAIESISPGQKAKDVDFAARSYIEKKGYGKNFGHGVGHGVGLEVHEWPTINKRSKEILEEGMVFTVEPGIYIPDWGGVRIEDVVLVISGGCKVLSHAPKKLSELGV